MDGCTCPVFDAHAATTVIGSGCSEVVYRHMYPTVATVWQSPKPPQHTLSPPIEGTLFEFRFQTYQLTAATLSCFVVKTA